MAVIGMVQTTDTSMKTWARFVIVLDIASRLGPFPHGLSRGLPLGRKMGGRVQGYRVVPYPVPAVTHDLPSPIFGYADVPCGCRH